MALPQQLAALVREEISKYAGKSQSERSPEVCEPPLTANNERNKTLVVRVDHGKPKGQPSHSKLLSKSRKPRKGASREGNLKPNEPQLSPDAQECPKWLYSYYLKQAATADDYYTIAMHQDTAVTTDSSGNYSIVFGNAPANFSGWGTLSTTFEEFRVLGLRVKFSPIVITGGTAANIFATFMTCIDRDSSTPLASYSAGNSYSSAKEHMGNKSWVRHILMSGSEDSGFLNAANGTTATFYLKTYSSGNSTATTIGRVEASIVVQLRTRGL